MTLTRYFSALVRATFDAETLAEINRRNATPEYACACATHDFHDANSLMFGAWCALHFEAPALGDEEGAQQVAHQMNEAWAESKAMGFADPKPWAYRNRKPVTIRGVYYESFTAAAIALRVPQGQIAAAVKRGTQDNIGTRRKPRHA